MSRRSYVLLVCSGVCVCVGGGLDPVSAGWLVLGALALFVSAVVSLLVEAAR